MRRFAILAAVLCLCGCGTRSAHGPVASADHKAAGSGSDEPAASAAPSHGASYLEANDAACRELEPEIQSELHQAEQLAGEQKLGLAIEALDQIIEKRPKTALAFALRARVRADLRQDADAIADLSTAILLEPQNPKHLLDRGLFQLSHGNTTKAIADFDKAVEIDPQNAQAYNHRGSAHTAMGEVKQALIDFNKAIEIDPKYVAAYNNRSLAYAKADRHSEAMADLDRAIAIDPKVSGPYENRGVFYFEDHEYEKALSDFSKAIELDGQSPAFYNNRRQTYVKLGRFAEARRDASKLERMARLSALNDAVFRDKRSSKPYMDRGVFLLEERLFQPAIVNFDRALELNGKCWDAYAQRARAWIGRGEFQKAVDDCTVALDKQPREETFGTRGDAYRKLGQYEKAIADYEASQRFDRDVADTWLLYSQSLRQAGHIQEADEAVKQSNTLLALSTPKSKSLFDPNVRQVGNTTPAAKK